MVSHLGQSQGMVYQIKRFREIQEDNFTVFATAHGFKKLVMLDQ